MIISTMPNRQKDISPWDVGWWELKDKLTTPIITPETYNTYLSMDKATKDNLKDVGGFVGGTFTGNKRKKAELKDRSLITLDLDNLTPDNFESIKNLNIPYSYIIYSTRSHTEDTPRLRVVIPLKEPISPELYEPLSRQFCDEYFSMAWADRTTFQGERLMYFPSHSSDYTDFYSMVQTRHELDGEAFLNMYPELKDTKNWPRCPGEEKNNIIPIHKHDTSKLEDPLKKKGLIGAFCRTYTIDEAIDTYLSDYYTPAGGNRYTHTGSTTTGGAVNYENKWLHSFHANDPWGEKSMNAYDLVLNVLFEGDTKKMEELINEDEAVKAEYIDEMGFEPITEATKEEGKEDNSWVTLLEFDKGGITRTIDNIQIILDNDPLLKGRLEHELFTDKKFIHLPCPWDVRTEVEGAQKREWTDDDDSGLRWYLEKFYKIGDCIRKVEDAKNNIFKNRAHDDVLEYFSDIKGTWDGVPRVETLYIDYFGTPDNEYTRAASRKALKAVVKRQYKPGAKFDCATLFVGEGGTGKSTLVEALGQPRSKPWHSSALPPIGTKDAQTHLRGVLIIELAELSVLSKAEDEAVKAFLSARTDRYRPHYGKSEVDKKRRCIFFGNSNRSYVLKDKTGSRRFWPIQVIPENIAKDVFTDFNPEIENNPLVDQVWAEALYLYESDPTEILDMVTDEEKKYLQAAHDYYMEDDTLDGMIAEWLDHPIPIDFYDWDMEDRRIYLSGELKPYSKTAFDPPLPEGEECFTSPLYNFNGDPKLIFNPEKRQYVCSAQIYEEAMGFPLKQGRIPTRRESNTVADIMQTFKNWKRGNGTKTFSGYGKQRYWVRVSP